MEYHGGMKMEIYDAKKDKEFSKGFVDIDDMRQRKLPDGSMVSYRYVHGGFEGTNVKFSFCFPDKEHYEGRFYQHLSPFPGPDEELAPLPVEGEEDVIGFCLTHGAYCVATNMGSKAAFSSSDDSTLTYRSCAACAEFSRMKACEVYGYIHRPYGYVFGGSGGGYRTIACIENTNAFDGAIPYVIGSPVAIPNCQTTRAHAERLLRDKIQDVIAAMEPGGSGDPYAGLEKEEADALREATLFGYPIKSWFESADLKDGSLPVLLPGVKTIDPTYFEDFWKVPGYYGADPEGSAVRDRICMDSAIKLVYISSQKAVLLEGREIDTRNGVNDAWKKMISSESIDTEPWIELTILPEEKEGHSLYLKGTRMSILNGRGAGRILQVGRIEENRVYFTDGYKTDGILETLGLLEPGDSVHIDNSDYIAVQTYHRHQIPAEDYHAWDQFRDKNGRPLYPQRNILIGPRISSHGTGCQQNGQVQGKVILIAAAMDEQGYPWQPDWYRRKVESANPGADVCRLWYCDNCLHADTEEGLEKAPFPRIVTYVQILRQALLDLAAWVEKDEKPLPSTNYRINVGEVILPEDGMERGGIQPVAHLSVKGEKGVTIEAGESVSFMLRAEVPDGAGRLTAVQWSFEGENDFPVKGELQSDDDGQTGICVMEHIFEKPGVYYPAARVSSERNGDRNALFTQAANLDRVCVKVRGK